MDPNVQPPSNQPLPQQPEPVAYPAQDAPSPAPVAPTPQGMPGITPVQPVSGGNKKGLIIGAIIGAIVILILVLATVTIMALPALQSKGLAKDFMTNITTGNVDKAVERSGDPASKTFLETASKSVKGSFKEIDSKFEDGKGYYLYELSGAEKKYARVTTVMENGKRIVDSFVYSNEKLALVPAKAESTAKAPVETTPTAASQPAASACLAQDDYKWFFYDKKPSSVKYDSNYDPAKFTANATADMFFKPDSTTETSFASIYDDWADFAKHNTDKQWKFRLEGSTYGSDAGTAASKALADQRAQKVKAELVKRGVPADRIVINPPHNYAKENQNDAMNEIYRRVQVVIDPTCTTTGSNR